ncbi:Transposon Tf2-6 poly [Paramuricea clavata]|uniref:Transposon Tf2-6 poly n=1 Tax=Paramuricea clavata TaxID=317549 RepID=A0A6S7HVS4_PARCT|nr:Transposon Tf2-6 poly [Paramuricea clavata]
MACIDLKDAYYLVPVAKQHQKFLKFTWKGRLYQFTCLAQGLSSAPRLFTKLMKPVFSHLRGKGHISSGYIDDSFLVGYSNSECQLNVDDTLQCFHELGFLIHDDKSVITPTQIIQHLGFVLNSIEMTIFISEEKHNKLCGVIISVLKQNMSSIRAVAQMIGMMVACCPGVEYGPLFYRQIDRKKTAALKVNQGDFDKHMTLSPKAHQDMLWWVENARLFTKWLNHGKIGHVLYTDASTKGWRANMANVTTGGEWSTVEKDHHINYLELRAVLFGLQSLCREISNAHVKVMTDNTTAVVYINNMGGSRSFLCNDMAREVWAWCMTRNIWLTASHIPGKLNVVADKASRVFDDSTEWKLDANIFPKLTAHFGTPEVDMFASRLNYQMTPFVSWHPDPQAWAIDAFTLDRNNIFFYAFPPFSIIPQVLQKLDTAQTQAILIVPNWPIQPWYPLLTRLLIQQPILLPKYKSNVSLPFKQEKEHPLGKQLKLMACLLSGDPCQVRAFHQKLKQQYSTPGGLEHKNNTKSFSTSGSHLLISGMQAPSSNSD